ncbi:AMP-binding protein [Stappia sp.]|uniref:AMP-binding protein n=1 Tax=Stappia sp. TaxID=1870903 RepID=UPI0032D8D19F
MLDRVMSPHALAPQDLADRLLADLAGGAAGTISDSTETVSFDGIRRAALRITGHLEPLGTGAVAVCAQKHPATIAAVLGVLAAGRAYAPLDPTHPKGRWIDILAGLRPSAVIVDASTREKLQGWAAETGTPLLDLGEAEDLEAGVNGCAMPAGCAAVLHTSGSTGVPKQVRIGADAIGTFCEWVAAEFGVCSGDVLLSHSPLAFDLSFLDIFVGLSRGASLVLADSAAARSGARLSAMIADHGVTVLHATPSALGMIVDAAGGRVFPSVRCVLFAGEPMSAARLAGIARAFPNARLTNIYGCTETNDTFFYDVPRDHVPDPLPLGRPLPYTDHLVMTPDARRVEPGEEGELWVRCPTMMIGYADPELTRRVSGQFEGKTYYRTGDRVRMDADGLVYILGRIDSVRKVNGYRVDLAEIEACLMRHPGVRETAVFLGENDQLAAVVSSDDPEVKSLGLRMHAMQTLPAYAIPKSFCLTSDPLPKNSNGKICRKTIAASPNSAAASTA